MLELGVGGLSGGIRDVPAPLAKQGEATFQHVVGIVGEMLRVDGEAAVYFGGAWE